MEDTATIAAGTLLINGTMGTGSLDVTVDSAGTLGGNGTIDGNVTNNGTLSPGNSIGTLTIDGDYTHESGAVFSVELDRTRADLLDVTGTVTGNGGTVDVTPVGVVEDGHTYDIITAGNVLAGDGFDSDEVYVSPVLTFWIDTAPETDPDTVQLIVERTSYADALGGGTSNQFNIAGALQGVLDDPGNMEDLLLQLDTLPDEDALGEAINGLSPEHYAALSGAIIEGGNLFRGVLLDRLGAFHRGGLASLEPDRSSANASNALTDSGPILANVPAPRTNSGGGIWIRGFGGFADQNNVDDKAGYNYNTYGAAIGIDGALTDNLIVGIGGGYEATDLDHDTIDAETDISTILASLYGSYVRDRYYIDASFTYGWNDFDSDRYVPLVDKVAKSDHSGNYYSAYIGAGYNIGKEGGWMFVPTASLQYAHFEEDSFTESGADSANLTVAESDVDSWVSKLGFRLGHMTQMGNAKVLPEISLEWAHELGDNDREVSARFLAGDSFTVTGIDPERNSALFGFALTVYASDSVTMYLNYDLELRSDFDAHAVSAGLRYNF